MNYFRSGDPLMDFARRDRYQERLLAQLPVCEICDNPIQADHYYEINGDVICPGCLDYFRKDVDVE
jgi:hypothetical protein